jgi:hypothetical protein
MMRRRSEQMDTMISSIFWGVAGDNPATCSYEQSMAFTKSKWHSEAGAMGLKCGLFHISAMASNTVGGLVSSKQVKCC